MSEVGGAREKQSGRGWGEAKWEGLGMSKVGGARDERSGRG